MAQKPIGSGACCNSCGDRRRPHLRHVELQRGFLVLCHNCAARARALKETPRSQEGLLERIERERRRGERRGVSALPSPGPPGPGAPRAERRRRVERRVGARDLLDLTDFAVEEPAGGPDGEITRIHRL